MFFIIQCKLKIWISILIFTFYIINQIYLIIFHPTPTVILIKWSISFVMEVLEQPGSETHEHNVVAIRKWRQAIVDKQRTLLADVDVTPPRGLVQITWHFSVLHREMQAAGMLVSFRQLHWECKYNVLKWRIKDIFTTSTPPILESVYVPGHNK